MGYQEEIQTRFWECAQRTFESTPDVLEVHPSKTRPPVFVKEKDNVLLRPGASEEEINNVLQRIKPNERHRWFRSMKSSQALALSVFGNLMHYGKTDLLEGLCCEQGTPIFAGRVLNPDNFQLEYEVSYLGEPRQTNVDVFLLGAAPLAIECKFTEPEVGACSRPKLTENDTAYDEQFCDGSYRAQRGRNARCPLTERGVKYWEYIPDLFKIDTASDYKPCPLQQGYQLFRNILAAAYYEGKRSGSLLPAAMLLYDERNPEFQPGGSARNAFDEVSGYLKNKNILRRCSWQMLILHLRKNGLMSWLSDGLALKYGF